MTPTRRMLLLSGLMAGFGATAPALALDGPDEPIKALNEALLAGMRAGRATPFATRAARLRPVIERVFDLPVILEASVGPRFAGFPEASKAALREAFTTFTVATWVGNFDVLDGETFAVAAERRKSGSDEIVTARIVPRAGEPTRLDYVMRLGAPGWRVVDILLNGTISRVAVQRSDFRALVAGGDPAALIASLAERAASLAAGNKP